MLMVEAYLGLLFVPMCTGTVKARGVSSTRSNSTSYFFGLVGCFQYCKTVRYTGYTTCRLHGCYTDSTILQSQLEVWKSYCPSHTDLASADVSTQIACFQSRRNRFLEHLISVNGGKPEAVCVCIVIASPTAMAFNEWNATKFLQA